MNESQKTALTVGLSALVVTAVLSAGVLLGKQPVVVQPQAAAAPVVVPAAQPSVVVQPISVPSQGTESSEDSVLGGLIHNIQESFDAGIAVKGTPVLDANRNVTTTGLYVSDLSRGNVMGKLVSSMSSSATTTACSFLNSSGSARIVTGAGVIDTGTAASTGSVAWKMGTSTYPGVSIAFTKVVDALVTRASGADVITTTSTVLGSSGAYTIWRNGEYFLGVSNTSTNAGKCFVSYYAP